MKLVFPDNSFSNRLHSFPLFHCDFFSRRDVSTAAISNDSQLNPSYRSDSSLWHSSSPVMKEAMLHFGHQFTQRNPPTSSAASSLTSISTVSLCINTSRPTTPSPKHRCYTSTFPTSPSTSTSTRCPTLSHHPEPCQRPPSKGPGRP